jgi:anti-anti-sigma factor
MLTGDNERQILVTPGRLVAETRLEFRRTALEYLDRATQRNAARLVLEMGGTTEIDASGLGVLVLLQKRARERMVATKLLHAPPAVKQMLRLTRLDYLFEMEG